MLSENLSRREIVEKYTRLIEPFFVYIPWLEKVSGNRASSLYSNEGIGEHSMAFPVYDSTLLSFVKQLSQSEMMNRNYAYHYSWKHMKSVEDELRVIDQVTLYEVDVLEAILSRYALGGMTKGVLWSQAIEYGIFLKILLKFKEVLDYWEKRPEA